jgi:hypothetical protein
MPPPALRKTHCCFFDIFCVPPQNCATFRIHPFSIAECFFAESALLGHNEFFCMNDAKIHKGRALLHGPCGFFQSACERVCTQCEWSIYSRMSGGFNEAKRFALSWPTVCKHPRRQVLTQRLPAKESVSLPVCVSPGAICAICPATRTKQTAPLRTS